MKTVIINGIVYQDLPSVDIPQSNGQGDAHFFDTDDATLATGADLPNGVTAYAAGVKYTGSANRKAAQTYTPTTSDQTIQAGQFLDGAQTVKGDANLVPGNIRSGVTLFNVQGTLTSATIVQDPVTKVLSIS